LSQRTLAAVAAGVVALGGGGAWFALHSSGGTAPAAAVATHPAVHHKASPAKPRAPHTRADALKTGTAILAVLREQFPGWKVDGKPTIQNPNDNSDPVSRSIQQCLAGASSRGYAVTSPEVTHTTATPSYLSVDVTLGFVRNAARATADLAVLGRASAQRCIAKQVVGRTVSMGSGASLRFTSMKPLQVPGRAVGWEFDGQIQSNVIGGQSVRVVMLATVDRATEILLTSTGLGAALPLSADLRVLHAITAQTHRVIG
jgi:hypothetical protein